MFSIKQIQRKNELTPVEVSVSTKTLNWTPPLGNLTIL